MQPQIFSAGVIHSFRPVFLRKSKKKGGRDVMYTLAVTGVSAVIALVIRKLVERLVQTRKQKCVDDHRRFAAFALGLSGVACSGLFDMLVKLFLL